VRFDEGKDDEDVLRGIIERIYSVCADDAALRAGVRKFDRLRAEYPVRREFFNVNLMLPGAGEELHRKFASLGFILG
jgi:hypothetical protein